MISKRCVSRAVFILLPFVLSGCASKKVVTLHPPCAVPASLNDGWEVATPDQSGMDSERICSTLSTIANGDANLHGILIERHGRIVSEFYRSGPDRPITVLFGLWNPFSWSTDFDSNTLHDTRSVSKSVISLALGIVQEKGKLRDLRQPLLKYYPELKEFQKPELQSITLEHLLTMTSGLEWDEGSIPNDETKLYWKENQACFFLDRPLLGKPGQTFHYNSGGTAILAEVLTRESGTPWLETLRTDLFAPLGITQWEWANDYRNRPLAFTGLRMRPRDMLKLGRLLLDHGRWKGRQIVPEAWIEASLLPRVRTGIRIPETSKHELEYGYFWWSGAVDWKEKTLRWNAAFGNGGQRIFVVPELDTAIVITAGDYGSYRINPTVHQLFESLVDSIER